MSTPLITSIAHINLIIPHGTLDQAKDFYGNTLGLTPRAVPERQKTTLAWFDIADSGQQVHIAFGPDEAKSSRHPCFRIGSPDALLELRQRIWEHHEKGGDAAPLEADRPGEENSGMFSSSRRAIVLGTASRRTTVCSADRKTGSKGVEYPQRFFARDFAGNRLEFSL